MSWVDLSRRHCFVTNGSTGRAQQHGRRRASPLGKSISCLRQPNESARVPRRSCIDLNRQAIQFRHVRCRPSRSSAGAVHRWQLRVELRHSRRAEIKIYAQRIGRLCLISAIADGLRTRVSPPARNRPASRSCRTMAPTARRAAGASSSPSPAWFVPSCLPVPLGPWERTTPSPSRRRFS
jgi:hypothetical protein